MIDALPLGEIRGPHAPLAPTFGDIKYGIEHSPHAQGARASPTFGGGDQLFDPLRFFVGQVAWICLFIHISILHNPRRLLRQALTDAKAVAEARTVAETYCQAQKTSNGALFHSVTPTTACSSFL